MPATYTAGNSVLSGTDFVVRTESDVAESLISLFNDFLCMCGMT